MHRVKTNGSKYVLKYQHDEVRPNLSDLGLNIPKSKLATSSSIWNIMRSGFIIRLMLTCWKTHHHPPTIYTPKLH